MFGGSTNIPKNTRHSYKKKEKVYPYSVLTYYNKNSI